MRNHSQRKSHSDARDGGEAAPRPGRSPRGAKNSDSAEASISMPSDWYNANAWATARNDKKAMAATASAARGHRPSVNATGPANPTPTSAVSAASLVDSHNRLGAIHRRAPVVSPARSAVR